MGTVQNYLNPITIEAKLFAQSLGILSETYNTLDVHLVEALENVMTTIENFIDKNTNNEIVDTSKTKLTKCDDLSNIQRIYHCKQCQRDLGKTAAKVALHVADGCRAGSISEESQQKSAKKQEKIEARAERKEKRKDAKEQQKCQRFKAAVKISKKTSAFLSMDYTKACSFLNDFIQVGDKLKCLPDYFVIENDIIEIIKPEFPQQPIKLYKFGSRVSGIGTRESDLDIYIDVGEKFREFENRASKETVEKLRKLRKVMQSNKKTWKGMVVVDSARVPIIKIIHTKTGIECDINFSNSLGYINSQFLEFLFSLQPMAHLMCIYMKKWLSRTNQKDEFSTYSVNLMVIFYLQQEKLLPPISKFFENVDMNTALIVGPWLSSFVRLSLNDLGIQLAKKSNLMQYIIGFFEFYLKFNFDSNIVCPYAGKPIRKQDLKSVMPSRYISYIESEVNDVSIVLNKPMTVQDPIQLNNNVTKGLSNPGMSAFKELMVRSLQIIKHSNGATVATN